MDAQLIIHVDGVEVWWAELSGAPGFTASAPSLHELRSVIADCLPDLASDIGEPVNIVSERLAGDMPPVAPAVESDQRPTSRGVPAHTKILVAA